jgi:hypothetical protein
MGREGYAALMRETRYRNRTSAGKPKEMRPHGKFRSRWKGIRRGLLSIELRIECAVVDWIQLAEDWGQGRALENK